METSNVELDSNISGFYDQLKGVIDTKFLAFTDQLNVKKEELKENTLEYISNNQSLTDAQKKKLRSLHESSSKEMTTLNEEINKTKMVLVKTLMEPKVSRSKVALLRKDLKKLEKKRMDSSLSSFDKAQNIITPITDLETRKRLYNSFLMREGQYNNL